MARIFLSYAREDAAKAGTLAKALERSGHHIWWDLRIGGGARFASEIAAALKNAEAVVVLWSRNSVESSWVQDEAAEGRDGGRLVPLLLDGTRPPLGFRQFQAIDLSRWSGRGRIPKLSAIDAAITTVLRGGTLARPVEPTQCRRALFSGWGAKATAALALVVVITGISFYVLTPGRSPATATTLAVLPFDDLSANQNKAYFAEGISEQIRTLLSEEPRLRIIGRSSTAMIGERADLTDVRKRLGVSHVIEGSVRIDQSKLRINVRLVDAQTGLRVWAEQFDRDLNDVFAVQDEIASQVVSRLRGGLVTHAAQLRQSRRTSTDVFDLYLGAMSKVYSQRYESALEAREMLQRAVEIDPKYAPAWLGLILAGFVIDQTNPAGQNLLPPEEYDRWLAYAKRAIALDPQLPDAHAWLGRVQSERFRLSGGRPDLLLAGARRAIELDPNNYRGWHESGRALNQLCRNRESVEAWERARALEPLLEYPAFNEVQVLTLAGRTGDAERVWREFHERSHKPYPLLGQMVELDRTDSSQAIVHGLAAKATDPGNPMAGVWLAVSLDALGYRDRALQSLPDNQRRTIGAYWRGDFSSAASQADQIRKLPNWSQMRTAAVLRSLHRVGQDDQLIRIVEERFGSIPNYIRSRCGIPFQAGLIASALRKAGRSAEADQLLAAEKAGWTAERAFGPVMVSLHVPHAEALLIAGDHNGALSELEYATAHGWTGHFSPTGDLQDPNFDPIRNHPRFKAVERRISQTQAHERRELAASGINAS